MNNSNPYIICLNTNVVYLGTREAERDTGADHSNISKVCKNKRKTVNGLKFAYFNPLIHTNYCYYDPSI